MVRETTIRTNTILEQSFYPRFSFWQLVFLFIASLFNLKIDKDLLRHDKNRSYTELRIKQVTFEAVDRRLEEVYENTKPRLEKEVSAILSDTLDDMTLKLNHYLDIAEEDIAKISQQTNESGTQAKQIITELSNINQRVSELRQVLKDAITD